MDAVSEKEVQQTALLSRIHFSQAELARFSAQIDEILNYIKKLQSVDTQNVLPTSHVIELSNITRIDNMVESPSSDPLLEIAPSRRGQLFKVPKVIEI